jgi:hypothetical protein
MKMKITLKTAIKAKNFNKKIERFCWENERNETNVFQLCCGKREKITLVTLVWLEKTLKVTLKWLQGCQ